MDVKPNPKLHFRASIFGWIFLGLLLMITLIGNRFTYRLLENPSQRILMIAGFSCLGIIIGQLAVGAIWLAIGPGKLINRVGLLAIATLALVCSWFLGFVDSFDDKESIQLFARDPIYFLGWIPALLLALGLPLLIMRWGWKRVLGNQLSVPADTEFTTRSLFMTTAIVALVIAGLEIPSAIGMRQGELFSTAAIFMGILLGGSLVLVLPAVLFLFSARGNVLFSTAVYGGWAIGLSVGTFALMAYQFRWLPTREIYIPVTIVVAAVGTMLLGIFTMRSFGLRLVRFASAEQRAK